MTKAMGVLLAGLMLVGCATTKPEMSNESYNKNAMSFSALSYCTWKGWISPDISANGKIIIDNSVRSHNTDIDRLNAEIRSVDKSMSRPTQGDCNQIAAMIQRQTKVVEQQNNQDVSTGTKIQNTFCNRIGTQLICSTY